MDNPLEILGRRYRTDKIIDHGYHRFYHDALKHLCDKKFNMMEIGVAGFNSVDMWKEYFPHAKVYGLDIGREYNDERLIIYRADQSKKSDLRDVISKMNVRCDFINDDGSHIPEHQLLTFDLFFNELLNNGGVYIIEDIEVSYWKRGELYGYPASYGYQHFASIVEKFKVIVDYINLKYIGPNDYAALLEKIGGGISTTTLDLISSITFAQNCIIIKKKVPSDYKYTRKEGSYRFADFVA